MEWGEQIRQYQTYTTYSNVKSLPEATAAAGPLELPPGGYLGLYGFLHVPWYLKLKPKSLSVGAQAVKT